MLSTLDGKNQGPDLFSGPIRKQLHGDAYAWKVVEFDKIPNLNFSVLTANSIENLCSLKILKIENQYHAYKISFGIISRDIQDNYDFKIGPFCHAWWITLPCHILRFYASQEHPCVYFPSWFQIKKHHFITNGPKVYFYILDREKNFSDDQVIFQNPANKLLSLLMLKRVTFDAGLRQKSNSQ